MGKYLVYKNTDNQNISLSGTKYEDVWWNGTTILCFRTGTHALRDVVRYGLTTDTTSGGLKLRIGDKKVAIAYNYTSTSTSTSKYSTTQLLSTASQISFKTRAIQFMSSSTSESLSEDWPIQYLSFVTSRYPARYSYKSIANGTFSSYDFQPKNNYDFNVLGHEFTSVKSYDENLQNYKNVQFTRAASTRTLSQNYYSNTVAIDYTLTLNNSLTCGITDAASITNSYSNSESVYISYKRNWTFMTWISSGYLSIQSLPTTIPAQTSSTTITASRTTQLQVVLNNCNI